MHIYIYMFAFCVYAHIIIYACKNTVVAASGRLAARELGVEAPRNLAATMELQCRCLVSPFIPISINPPSLL